MTTDLRNVLPDDEPLPLPRGVYFIKSLTFGDEMIVVTSAGGLAMAPFPNPPRRRAWRYAARRANMMFLDRYDPV